MHAEQSSQMTAVGGGFRGADRLKGRELPTFAFAVTFWRRLPLPRPDHRPNTWRLCLELPIPNIIPNGAEDLRMSELWLCGLRSGRPHPLDFAVVGLS